MATFQVTILDADIFEQAALDALIQRMELRTGQPLANAEDALSAYLALALKAEIEEAASRRLDLLAAKTRGLTIRQIDDLLTTIEAEK